MWVNLTAQTLRHSVPTGLNILCALKCLQDDASTAAELIETFD